MKTLQLVRIAAFFACISALSGTLSTAGEFNKKLKIGDAAPQWKDLPGTDGKKHSFEELKGKKLALVVFTCNSCPCAEGYEDRILRFAEKYKESVAVVAVNVNTITEDKLDKMKAKAEAKKFAFAYLYDESQAIAKDYGATYTPEFFLLDQDRKIAYMGAMDDKNEEKDAKVNFLNNAVEALLKGGKVETAETLGRGCLIRYARKREDR